MAFGSLRSYLQVVSGVGEVSRAKAVEAAESFAALGMSVVSGPAVGQAAGLAEEILAAARANRESLVALVRHEVEQALTAALTTPTAELERAKAALAGLADDLDELRGQVLGSSVVREVSAAGMSGLGLLSRSSSDPRPPAAADLSERVAAPAVPATETDVPAKKTAAKKTAPAKKTAAKKAAPVKKAAAKKVAPAKKTAAKNTAAGTTAAKKATPTTTSAAASSSTAKKTTAAKKTTKAAPAPKTATQKAATKAAPAAKTATKTVTKKAAATKAAPAAKTATKTATKKAAATKSAPAAKTASKSATKKAATTTSRIP